jgi:hypothetical protein
VWGNAREHNAPLQAHDAVDQTATPRRQTGRRVFSPGHRVEKAAAASPKQPACCERTMRSFATVPSRRQTGRRLFSPERHVGKGAAVPPKQPACCKRTTPCPKRRRGVARPDGASSPLNAALGKQPRRLSQQPARCARTTVSEKVTRRHQTVRRVFSSERHPENTAAASPKQPAHCRHTTPCPKRRRDIAKPDGAFSPQNVAFINQPQRRQNSRGVARKRRRARNGRAASPDWTTRLSSWTQCRGIGHGVGKAAGALRHDAACKTARRRRRLP